MPGVWKSCCGSLCVVAGSDKCCEHETRKAPLDYSHTRSELATYWCPSCWNRKGGDGHHQFITRKVLGGNGVKRGLGGIKIKREWGGIEAYRSRNAVLATYAPQLLIVLGSRYAPPLLPAMYKQDCGHYCRADTEICCQCQHSTLTGKPRADQPPSKNMCDCCIIRHTDSMSGGITHHAREAGKARRTTNLKSELPMNWKWKLPMNSKSKLPALNCSLDQEIESEDSFPEDPLSFQEEEEEAVDNICDMWPRNVGSVPLPSSSQDRTVFEHSEADWPDLAHKNKDCPGLSALHMELSAGDLPVIAHNQEDQQVDFPEEESDSLVFLEDEDSTIQQDEWELLSAAGSVWTLESTATTATRSFRDALLAQGSALPKTPLPTTAKSPAEAKTAVSSEHTEEQGDDFLADLRDEYKNGRGGKAKQMYHREHKGRASHKYRRPLGSR